MLTIQELIQALGGPSSVANKLSDGEHPTSAAVQMWAQRDHVPWRWRQSFAKIAASEGIDLPADFFDPHSQALVGASSHAVPEGLTND